MSGEEEEDGLYIGRWTNKGRKKTRCSRGHASAFRTHCLLSKNLIKLLPCN